MDGFPAQPAEDPVASQAEAVIIIADACDGVADASVEKAKLAVEPVRNSPISKEAPDLHPPTAQTPTAAAL